MRKTMLWAATALTTAYGGTVLGSGAARAADTIVVQWNDVTLANVRTTHPGPPIVARMLMVVDTCMYNAWTAFDPVAAPTIGTAVTGIGKLPAAQVSEANKAVAISYAAYRAMIDLFPTNTGPAIAMMTGLGLDPTNVSTDTTTPAGVGNVACAAVLAMRHHDGSNQLGDLNGGAPYSDYTGYMAVNTADVINDPNRWQPLRISDGHGGTVVQKYVTPFWGAVTPFNAGLTLPTTEGPDAYPSDAFSSGLDRVLQYSAQLTDRTKVIAEYWADGPSSELPPGHWSLFAKFVSERDSHTIDQDAKMFFAESSAIFDSSVQSWRIKRLYDSVRPVTAVHFARAGVPVLAWAGPYQGTQWIDGASWEPYQAVTVVTPPFPEYLVGAQYLQRDRVGDPETVHRERRVRRQLHAASAYLPGGAADGTGDGGDAELADLHGCGERGRAVAAVRWDPLRAGRHRWAGVGASARRRGLGLCGELLQRDAAAIGRTGGAWWPRRYFWSGAAAAEGG